MWRQDIKKKEYLCAAAGAGLLCAGAGYLFYHTLAACVILVLVGMFPCLYMWEQGKIKKKQEEFQIQFQEGLRYLSAALRAGYSVENAMKEMYKEVTKIFTKGGVFIKELDYMQKQLKLRIPVEQVWQECGERTRMEDVQNFAQIFSVAKRSGGNLIEIIQNTIGQIHVKQKVQREIEVMAAGKRMEFRIMSVIPAAIIGYMCICFPDFMQILYENLAGRIVMTVCLFLYAGAYFWGRRILSVEY